MIQFQSTEKSVDVILAMPPLEISKVFNLGINLSTFCGMAVNALSDKLTSSALPIPENTDSGIALKQNIQIITRKD